MIPYLKRPRVLSFWRYLGREVQVRSCSPDLVVCRPAADYAETDAPLVYAMAEFLATGEPMQRDMIPAFNEPGLETAQLEAP